MFIKYFKKVITSKKGFTLVESIVAILIITIGITPALYITTSASRLSENIENNLIASQLAQEGLELVRFLRDRNRFLCNDFSTELTGASIVDYASDWSNCSIRDLTNVGSPPLVLNIEPSGRYSYGAGTPTKFSRAVTVTEVIPNVELRVISTVSWPSKRTKSGCPVNTECISAESHLYNWMAP